MSFDYFSMFSGIGGFELGIQSAWDQLAQSGARTSEGRTSGNNQSGQFWDKEPHCVGYSEIDKYAIATYQHHFGGHTNYGDATTIDPAGLPDFGLLVGGFPCQAFSVAGKRRGFDEARGTLIFDVLRILDHKRPRHLVLENVKGLLTHESGETFQKILGFLADLGYRVEWQVLNSKDFGVPQNRERVYIVGHLGTECGRQVFPIGGSHQEAPQVHPTIDANYYKGQSNQRRMIQQLNNPERQRDRVYGDGGPSPTLLGNSQGGGRAPIVQRQATLQGARIRRLTPTECERLQGFPDDWTLGSDTQRYKQCGNAVTVNVVEAVIRGMAKCLS